MTEEANLQSEFTGKLFLIVGPSGSGKGTVIEALKSHYPGFLYPVSYTTRDTREGEKEGEVYHFVSREEFERMIAEGELLEYATVHASDYYGTSKKEIIDALKGGAVVMREIDIQGFHSIEKIIPKENLVSIFMKVSDEDDLRGRILRRGELPEEEVERRMKSAKKEIAQADSCNYQVENVWGEIDTCVREVEKIILAEIEDLY